MPGSVLFWFSLPFASMVDSRIRNVPRDLSTNFGVWNLEFGT